MRGAYCCGTSLPLTGEKDLYVLEITHYSFNWSWEFTVKKRHNMKSKSLQFKLCKNTLLSLLQSDGGLHDREGAVCGDQRRVAWLLWRCELMSLLSPFGAPWQIMSNERVSFFFFFSRVPPQTSQFWECNGFKKLCVKWLPIIPCVQLKISFRRKYTLWTCPTKALRWLSHFLLSSKHLITFFKV